MLKLHRDKGEPKPLTFGDPSKLILQDHGIYNGLDPQSAKEQGLHGFVYRVTIKHERSAIADEYVGSKAFGKGNGWQTYTTSSNYVKPVIARAQQFGGPVITYTILAYGHSEQQLKAIECTYIMECRKRLGSRYCLNKALANGDLLSSKSTYNKYKAAHKRQASTRYTG